MTIPRITENLALNNLALVGIATFVLLVGFGLAMALSIWLARRAARASNVEAVEAFVNRVWKTVRLVATILSMLVVLGACALLAVTVWQETDIQQRWVAKGAQYVTWHHLWLVVRFALVVIGVVVGSLYLRRFMEPLIQNLADRLLRIEVLVGQDVLVGKLTGQLKPVANITLVYFAFKLGAAWLDLPAGLHWIVAMVILVLLVVPLARTLVFIVHLVTDSLDRLGESRFGETRFEVYYDEVRKLWPLAKRSFEAVVYLAAARMVLSEFDWLGVVATFTGPIMSLIGIFFLARVLVEVSRVLVREVLVGGETLSTEARARRVTVTYLLQSVTKYLIYFGAGIAGMYQIGINPAPILAGAGILGLAVSLGAQKLINDMVNGFFILFEGQLLAGDYVKIGEAEGIVEQVSIRVSTIRDNRGRLHTIRNGNIENVINYSKDWVNAVVDIGVAYEMDFKKVLRVLNEAADALMEEHPGDVLEKTRILGLDEFGDSAVVILTATKVMPAAHLRVQRAFRALIKEYFLRYDIEIPYPKQVEIRQDADGNPIDSKLD